MAIALDATSSSTVQTSSPTTWNHTCTGSNLILSVCVTTFANLSYAIPSAVTYNGVSMTLAREDIRNDTVKFVRSSIWLLYAPATGSNQISVTWSGGTTPQVFGGAMSYTGAQQSSTADAVGGTTGANSAYGSKTFTVTTVADNCWVICACANIDGSVSPTLTAGQTQRWKTTETGFANGIGGGEDTNGPKTPAGSQTMGWTTGGTGTVSTFAMSGASFAPASGGTTTSTSTSTTTTTTSTSTTTTTTSTSTTSSTSTTTTTTSTSTSTTTSTTTTSTTTSTSTTTTTTSTSTSTSTSTTITTTSTSTSTTTTTTSTSTSTSITTTSTSTSTTTTTTSTSTSTSTTSTTTSTSTTTTTTSTSSSTSTSTTTSVSVTTSTSTTTTTTSTSTTTTTTSTSTSTSTTTTTTIPIPFYVEKVEKILNVEKTYPSGIMIVERVGRN